MRALALAATLWAALAGAPLLKGDLNADGAVDGDDARRSLLVAIALVEPPASEGSAADANGDGRTNLGDTVWILFEAAGLGESAQGEPARWDAFRWNLARWG